MGRGAGNIIFEASVVQWKDIRPWRPEYGTGQKGSILFLDYFFILGDAAKLRWAGGARSAPFGVAMSSKRRVRAEHGRARAAKTH